MDHSVYIWKDWGVTEEKQLKFYSNIFNVSINMVGNSLEYKWPKFSKELIMFAKK